jgi:hypothetical protein
MCDRGARLVPLAELAIFAAECGAHDRVSKYIAEARTLGPGPPELHSLLTAAGIVAIDCGNTAEAKDYLIESARVCREGDFASVACGVQGFRITLAEKLLERGESQVVVSYLTECKLVWIHQKEHIDSWICAIYAGNKPAFAASRFLAAMNNPVIRLRPLTLRASSLGEALTPEPLEPGSNIGREETLARFRGRTRAAIEGRLDVNKN